MIAKKPKVAIFYDWLNQWGGAERVLLDILKVYPQAEIFTLIHDPKKTNWLPKKHKVHTSIIQNLPFSKKSKLIYTPFYSLALEQFNFSNFDLVISTTSVNGYCLLTSTQTLFICYLHNTNRYLYQTPKQFELLEPLLKIYKKIDFVHSQRPDYLLCNSQTVQKRILKNYHRQSQVVYPGIDLSFFKPALKNTKNKYFLVISRLVTHKRIDIAIKACHQLNLKLIIVGQGRDQQQLKKLAKKINYKNIVFTGKIANKELLSLYQNCQALICPQLEDFGLTPLEAQASGKPVIAFNRGGITETIINNKTGLFFNQQNTQSLIKTLKKFSQKNFKKSDCVNNAKRFSQSNFMLNFKKVTKQLWQQHQNTIL
jgi:glycosyltransferase involved in cell wall biosynthesis